MIIRHDSSGLLVVDFSNLTAQIAFVVIKNIEYSKIYPKQDIIIIFCPVNFQERHSGLEWSLTFIAFYNKLFETIEEKVVFNLETLLIYMFDQFISSFHTIIKWISQFISWNELKLKWEMCLIHYIMGCSLFWVFASMNKFK